MFFRNHHQSEIQEVDPVRQLATEAGVSDAFFKHGIIGTLDLFSAEFGFTKEEKHRIICDGRIILARRRSFLLPKGIESEQLHRQKDRWTLAVWIVFLFQSVKRTHVASYAFISHLHQLIHPKAWDWIHEDLRLLEAIVGAVVSGSVNVNAKALLEITLPTDIIPEEAQYYGDLESDSQELELTDIEVSAAEESDVSQNPQPEELTNSEIGKQFLDYLFHHKGNLPAWATSHDGFIDVMSPKGFIEYAEERGLKWQKVQKGVQNQRMHVTENGSPFIRINNRNIVRLKIAQPNC